MLRLLIKRLGLLPLWVRVSGAGMIGCVVGLGLFTFTYARGYSYMGNDPKTCANCHVMQGELDGWNHSSHKAVAVCNDCHLPHDSVISKYFVKGMNGWHHSSAFTTGHFDEPIRIKKFNRDVAQQNCLRCHGDLTSMMNHARGKDPTDCLRCHSEVGHSH